MQEGDKSVGWQFTGAEKGSAESPAAPSPTKLLKSVAWTASEYVEHDKSTGWYVRFAAAAILAIGLIFMATRDLFSVVLLSVLAIAFGVFAGRKPSVLQYRLDNHGITIGPKFYPINMFRSFAIIEEGAFRSITLLPLKRFMPSISLYYAPDDETTILEAFSNLLPQEIRKQDAIDKFMHRIRF